MIAVRVKITGVDELRRLIPRTEGIIEEESFVAASHTAREQSAAILSGLQPNGAPQKEQAESTEARKRAAKVNPNVPLYRTGLLADASKWVVQLTKKGAVRLSAPPGRAGVVRILQSRGFVFVFDELPAIIVEQLRARIEARTRRL